MKNDTSKNKSVKNKPVKNKSVKNRAIKMLLKKEIMDVMRDRKAIIMLVLVPLLIYPLIFFGSFAVMSMIQSNMEQAEYKVILDVDDDGALEDQIDAYNLRKTDKNSSDDATENDENESDKNESADEETKKVDQLMAISFDEFLKQNNYDIADDTEETKLALVNTILQDEKADVYVGTATDENGKKVYTTRYVSSITNSDYAETLVKDVLDNLLDAEVKEKIEESGQDADSVLHPFDIKRENMATKEQSAGSLLGTILPFMLVISLLMGTMYPAIDTTAGEKERGTLETLLTLPVRNHEIIIAKFLTVAMIGIVSALLNIVSMGLMVFFILKMAGSNLAGSVGLNMDDFHIGTFVPAMLVTVLAVFAFSLFISAVTMCITALAKSYKEANNYITPLTLVVMLTAYIGFIPNIELTNGVALIPVANICLLVKNLLLFKAEMSTVAIVLLSNVVYSILAILFLSKIYDSESVLFDDGKASLQLFQKRSNMKKGSEVTTGDTWFIICLVMIVYLYVGAVLQMNYGITGVFESQLLIAGIPLIYAIYTKKNLKKTFAIKAPGTMKLFGGIVLFLGAFFIENTVSTFLYELFPDKYSATETGLGDLLSGANVWVTYMIVALAPAICEELFFRGFIFSGFKSRYKGITAIIASSVVFGIFHTSLIRFLPTTLLGIALAIMVYYSGSLLPSMLCHCCNNAVSLYAMRHPERLEKAFPYLFGNDIGVFGNVTIALIGAVLMYSGVRMLKIEKNRSKERSNGIE